MAFFYIVGHFLKLKTKHSIFQRFILIFNFTFSIIQWMLGLVSMGLFYGAIAAFLEHYTEDSTDTYFLQLLKNLLLFVFYLLSVISIGHGSQIRNLKVNWYLKVICIVLSLFNLLVFTIAYYKLFTVSPNLSILLSGVYISAFLFPPFLYNPIGSLKNIHRLLLGFICYILCIPMYQIVFQTFSYANFHDVTWGNREESSNSQ